KAGIALERHSDRVVWAMPGASAPTAPRLAEAAALLSRGELDAVLGGNQATTAEVIRAGISGVGLAPGCRTVSGAFVMNRTNGNGALDIVLFADCGVVIAPTVRQLVDIAVESVRTWRLVM